MFDWLLGGLGKSTDPNDYAVSSPNQGQLQGMMGQQAAQSAAADPTQQAQFRQMQMAQALNLQRIAGGQMQGAGELAAQRQVQNAIAAQQAQQRMVRGGGNAGLGLIAGARNAAGIGLSGAGMGQQAAMQDQQMAQGQLTGALGTGRQGDMGLMNMQQQNNQYNAGAQNQRYDTNMGALASNDAQRLQAQQNYMQATTGQQGLAGALIGTAGAVAAGALTHSDERLKTDITDAGDDINAMLDNLHAKTYRYKDEAKHGAGPRAGIIAQDLERSRAGRALVVESPSGKAFDNGKAISALLASAATLNARLRKLEAA